MKYSILVVDDQAENIRYISSLLKEMKLGSKIYSAPNGKIALELVKKVNPDLILSDWGMPEMDGIEFLKVLKSSKETKDIPFIMISAIKIDAESMMSSFEAGVHDYLKKPFDKLEFMARVNATLKLQNAYLKIKKNGEEITNQGLLLSQQNEELKKLNTLKDRIFSIISHDVKSPLATLDGLLELFNNKDIEINEKEFKTYVSAVRVELNNVQSLTDNLLSWANSLITNKNNYKTLINTKAVTQDIFNLFKDSIIKKSLNFNNRISTESNFRGDSNLISFVIRNLLANAIKFTPRGGEISADFERTPESVIISIKDTGIGMDTRTIKILFDKEKIMTQKGTSGEVGTGLGLKLCKELIEQNSGTLAVDSELGKGSVFKFTIPVERNL